MGNIAKNNVLAESYGLKINKITWEDCARTKGSCWGPNISDLTLDVGGTSMNMIRRPNFADITCDVSEENFKVTIGNEDGQELTRISLKEYVRSISSDLWDTRDSELLVSAQCCMLPLTEGEVEFCPKMYNYQSSVLVITSCSQGTSCQIMTEKENLYFNRNGQKVKYLAKRLLQDRKERGVKLEGEMTDEERDRNVIIIYQIPLINNKPTRGGYFISSGGIGVSKDKYFGGNFNINCTNSSFFCSGNNVTTSYNDTFEEDGCDLFGECQVTGERQIEGARTVKGVDNAMLRVSDNKLGEYTKLDKSKLKRDNRFPIRVTYQFYKVTDTEELDENTFMYISDKIGNIYNKGTKKGSLVLNKDSERSTESKKVEDDLKFSENIGRLTIF